MKKNVKLITTYFIILQFISMNFVFAIDGDNPVSDPTLPSSDVSLNDTTINNEPGLTFIVQTDENLLPVTDTDNIDTDNSIPLQTSNDVPLLQDTINTQEGSDSDALVTPVTTDTTISIVVPPVVEPQDIAPTDEVSNDTQEEIAPEINSESSDTSLSIESFTPVPVRQFSLTSHTIKTKKITKNVDKDTVNESQNLNTAINPTIDNTKGTISLSGSCSSTYFVVLLFKNANDYIDNPTSAILNKAFDCVNNSFSYTVDELDRKSVV